MSKIKIVLRKEKKQKDGKMPLAIRITKDRKLSYIHIGVTLDENQWDADSQTVKKHPNTKRLNHFLVTKLAEATDKALELETHKEYSSVKAVKAKIKPSVGTTFFPQMNSFIADLKAAGKYNQYTSDKSRLNRFKDYLKNDIAFQDITPAVLERFKSWLVVHEKVSERTAVNHLVSIRSVFSKAIRDEVIDARYYPFGKGKVKIKFPDSAKIGLTQEEVKKIEDAELLDPFYNHVRNLWLISFYFAGMRVSDVLRLKWSDFTDGRLHYSMGKNKKGGSFKIHDKAQAIIDKYVEFKTATNDLVFPELKECDLTDNFSTQRTITFKTSAIDKCLRNHVAKAAGIDKKLTMHIARHTVGNIARDKISIPILQKMFRHSSITTTAAYMANFKHEETDDALDMLIGEAQLTIAPKND